MNEDEEKSKEPDYIPPLRRQKAYFNLWDAVNDKPTLAPKAPKWLGVCSSPNVEFSVKIKKK